MGHFGRAMAFTAKWEGGFVDDPRDPGGATKYGISLRFLRSLAPELGDIDGDGDVDGADILALTPERARELYRANFWDPLNLDHLPAPAAVATFDTAVNMGRQRAVRILQDTARTYGIRIAVDGEMGPMTEAAARAMLMSHRDGFADRFGMRRLAAYSRIVAAKPSLAVYMRGWVNRTVALAETIR